MWFIISSCSLRKLDSRPQQRKTEKPSESWLNHDYPFVRKTIFHHRDSTTIDTSTHNINIWFYFSKKHEAIIFPKIIKHAPVAENAHVLILLHLIDEPLKRSRRGKSVCGRLCNSLIFKGVASIISHIFVLIHLVN